MENLVEIAIGLGLVVSLIFSEVMGLAAGGMVVPGYFALNLGEPIKVIVTLLTALATFGIVRLSSFFMIIYGRRRTVLMILVGFILGAVIRNYVDLEVTAFSLNLTVIGYIIPGLVAIWIDRQGIVETISTLLLSSVIVRMVLILLNGGQSLT